MVCGPDEHDVPGVSKDAGKCFSRLHPPPPQCAKIAVGCMRAIDRGTNSWLRGCGGGLGIGRVQDAVRDNETIWTDEVQVGLRI
jgi:hypothetical protein